MPFVSAFDYFSHIFVIFYSLAAGVAAQQSDADTWTPPNVGVSFRPSVAIVIGVFSLMFSLTFLLLIYAKFCHTNSAAANADASSELFGADASGHGRFLVAGMHRSSGIGKTVIESLPFFRFSALRGVRSGLECAVCLSKFTDAELLRLLPKCRHAFHLACVDRWLESHSSCPLCRAKVKAEDAALFKYSNSARLLFASDSSDALDLFVEREIDSEADSLIGSSRFSFRKSTDRASVKLGQNDHELPMLETGDDRDRFLHKFKHKIIVSDVVFKSRWSDVNSSDLMTLNSEMLATDWNPEPIASAAVRKASIDGKAIKIKEEMEKKRLLEHFLGGAGAHLVAQPIHVRNHEPTAVPAAGKIGRRGREGATGVAADREADGAVVGRKGSEAAAGDRKQPPRGSCLTKFLTETSTKPNHPGANHGEILRVVSGFHRRKPQI